MAASDPLLPVPTAPRRVSPPGPGRPAIRSAFALAGAVAFLAACSAGSSATATQDPGPHPPDQPATVVVDEAPGDGPSSATDDVAASDAPSVDARAYAVFDATSGRMLATDDADDRLAVGSLMKLLNARVAYDAGEPDRAVEVPEGIAGEAGESVIGLVPGQTVSRRVLIRAMLKVSANDAARLLAIDIAGSESAYAELMTQTAHELGLQATAAANATGLDADGQHSTATDLVHLGATLLQDPTFAETVADPDAVLNGQTYPNTNDLLVTYDGANGIKTGHTTDAGWCLLASASRGGTQMVVAVLGAPSDAARDAAAAHLLDWAFAQG